MPGTLCLTLFPTPSDVPHTDACILTPNPRAARAWGVPCRTIQSLAQGIIRRNHWNVAEAVLARRCLQEAVRRTVSTSDPEGMAQAVQPILSELFHAGADLPGLARHDSPRLHRLALMALRYQEQLHQKNLIDSAEVFRRALEFHPERRRILVLAYTRLNEDELRFIHAIADEDSWLTLPVAEAGIFAENRRAAAFLENRGWRIVTPAVQAETFPRQTAQSFLSSAQPPEAVRAHLYPDLEAEVRGTLAQAKALLEAKVPADEIALVTREERLYGPTLAAIAHEYQLPICLLYDIPLLETRLGAWLSLLLESIQRDLPFDTTVRLLAHPLGRDLKGIPEFEQAWLTLRRRHPAGLEAWQEQQIDLSLLHWQPQAARTEYIARLRAVFHAFRLQARCAYWVREIVAYQRLEQGLDEIEHLSPQTLSLSAFAREVHELLTWLKVPMQPGRGGIDLHTPISLNGARYRHVFVLGMAEGILPAPVQDNPRLDFFDRERLAQEGLLLENAVDAARREALTFWSLLAAAQESLTLSYPQVIERRELLPSPFFTRLGLSPRTPEPPPIAGIEEYRRLHMQQASPDDVEARLPYPAWQVERSRELDPLPDEFDGNLGLPLDPNACTFSAAQLTDLGQCPFKWFARSVLHLRTTEEAEEELSAATLGSFFHRILRRLAERTIRQPEPQQRMQTCLPQVFQEIEEEMELHEQPLWRLQRPELLAQLRQAIQSPEFLPSDHEILACEEDFDCDWYGFRITGSIDRIDRTQNGLVIIDYKNSSARPAGVKNAQNRTGLDIQLTLYEHALQTELYPEETVDDAFYYSLRKAALLNRGKDRLDEERFAAAIRQRLQQGFFPINPDLEQKSCRYCSYHLLCRKGPRLQRKEVQP